MNNIITVIFSPGMTSIRAPSDIWQWDYGQILQIQGLELPQTVEVHFANEYDAMAITRVGITEDGVTSVSVPDSILETEGTFFMYVFLADEESGNTEYRAALNVKARPKPEPFDPPVDPEKENLLREAIELINKFPKEAEAWAHGREDMPEMAEDNAAYYAGQAKNALEGLPEAVEEGKQEIDAYVEAKREELKGDTGNVYFAAFKVVDGHLIMYSNPEFDKVRFIRVGSRLMYRLAF